MVYDRLVWIGFVVALNMAGATAKAETIQVTIDKLVFAPRILNAKVGDTIEWINKDILAHTATVKGGWDVLIPAGKSASLVLDKAQSVEYYCRFHPNMRGRVTVTVP
jgi:plastocyanin